MCKLALVMANRPPRLDRLFEQYDPPLYFVTFNTAKRAPILATGNVHSKFRDFATRAARAARHDIAAGRYVIMPDHIHLFAAMPRAWSIEDWIRLLKLTLSAKIRAPGPHWQEGCFDHLIRNEESYAEKWEYVRQNPVRAGLVSAPELWPFQGEIVELGYR